MQLGTKIGFVAVIGALALAGAPAGAQNLDLDEVGAALALPVITGGGINPTAETALVSRGSTATAITITNAGEAVRLHVNVISGDEGDQWASQDFSCVLTAAETVLFVFEPAGRGQSSLTYECDEQGEGFGGLIEDVPLNTGNGIMFVALEDPETGETVNTNQIFGDAVVIDFGNGSAYSVGAIPFQGVVPGAPGVSDRKYRFDNMEYSEFPSVLATNFIAPGPNQSLGSFVNAELVLFTLDGTVGSSQPPPAQVSIKFFNDDEVQFSASHAFDCFDIVALRDIDSRFDTRALGSDAGHLTLTPQLVTYPNVAHDAQFDGGGVIGVRKTPVHGWLVQLIGPGEGGVSNQAAFARTLAQSRLPLVPHSGDTPVLNAP